jgi:hypothetical protein
MSGTTSRRLGGIVSVSVGGVPYDVTEDGVEYNANVVKRESAVGQSGISGFTVMPVAPMIKITFFTTPGVTAGLMNTFENVDIIIICANGTTVSGAQMWATETGNVNTRAGTFEQTFEGFQVIEDVP